MFVDEMVRSCARLLPVVVLVWIVTRNPWKPSWLQVKLARIAAEAKSLERQAGP